MTIRAAPERLAALYLDYARWPELFAATIRGVRLIERDARETAVEVDHRSEGRVLNLIRPLSTTEIELAEFKPRYDAVFVNRFELVPGGACYGVTADVRFRLPLALFAPLLGGVVRRRIRHYVLEPMRAYAERTLSVNSSE